MWPSKDSGSGESLSSSSPILLLEGARRPGWAAHAPGPASITCTRSRAELLRSGVPSAALGEGSSCKTRLRACVHSCRVAHHGQRIMASGSCVQVVLVGIHACALNACAHRVQRCPTACALPNTADMGHTRSRRSGGGRGRTVQRAYTPMRGCPPACFTLKGAAGTMHTHVYI